jgi:hypothetical protein
MLRPVGRGCRNFGPYEIVDFSGAYIVQSHPDFGKGGRKYNEDAVVKKPFQTQVPLERLIYLNPGEKLSKGHYPRRKTLEMELQMC